MDDKQRPGRLLKDLRKTAGLTQRELGQRIHLDGSMISRFETGAARLGPSTTQEIINILALYDIPRAELDELWQAAGYYRGPIEAPVAHPVVAYVQQEFEKLEPELREVLADDLRTMIALDQGYFSSKRDIELRRWGRAGEHLLALRSQLERRLQLWYLRVDGDLGWCHYSAGRYVEALQYYESALWSARSLDDAAQQAHLMISIGDTHRRLGGQGWQKARDLYRSAGGILENLNDRCGVADSLRKEAGAYLFRGEPDKAVPLIEESLGISEKEGYREGVYRGLQHQSWAFDLVGRWNEATELCETALGIVEEAEPDDWELAKAYRYLADAYRLQRRLDEAKESYEHALALLQAPEDTEGVHARLLVGRIELGLGRVYLRMPGGEMRARSSLNRAMEIHMSLGEDFAMAEVLGEQGELLLRLGRMQESESRLSMAREHLRKLGNVFHYANVLATLCSLYYRKGPASFGQLHDTAEEARQADNGLIDCHLARVELAAGKAHMDEKAYQGAFIAFEKASERAFGFNEHIFLEVCESITAEADRAVRTLEPDIGIRLCESQIDFWQDRLGVLRGSGRQRVAVWLDTLRVKQREFGAIKPVEWDVG